MSNNYSKKTNSRRPVSKKRNRKAARRSFFGKTLLAAAIVMISFAFLAFSPSRADASSTETTHRNKYYTCIQVECGDTLWDIAGEYCTEEYGDYYEYIEEVMQINNLTNSNIKSGIKLCIPYYAERPGEFGDTRY